MDEEYQLVVGEPPALPADAFTEMPADPLGWLLPLTHDGKWRPVAVGREVDLGEFDTKAEAVAAIAEHDDWPELVPGPSTDQPGDD